MAILTNTDVAGRVRGIAAERRVSRSAMAQCIAVSEMSLSRRLNGKTPFSAEELIKLSQTLGCAVGEFFGERAA